MSAYNISLKRNKDLKMKLESVSFQDKLVILLEKRFSGVAEQGYPRS